MRLTSRRWLLVGSLTTLFVIAVAGGFLLTQSQADPRGAAAGQQTETPTPDRSPASSAERPPGWYDDLVEDDEAEPRAEGVFNGIRVGPDLQRSDSGCERGTAQWVPVDRAHGSELDPRPSYLPPTAEPADAPDRAVECDGVVVSAEANFSVGTDADIPFGGPMTVFRVRIVDEPQYPLDHAESRVHGGEVGDRPAVIAEPLSDDGFGSSTVIVHEPAGLLTVIHASGVPLDELLRVASSHD